MKLLLVTATYLEAQRIINSLSFKRKNQYLYIHPRIDILVTGIGMVNTAFVMGKEIKPTDYEKMVNIGIAGSFDHNRKLGELVEVKEEIFVDLGVETESSFLSLEHIGFAFYTDAKNKHIFYNS
ncbi:MAG: hypothetical protein RML72_02325, partial [Bacteroidia bacterium]|nr:hypothetical protein [Bacteroidia bacterium]MDW8157696.1 hypothetical protein [Bacteroidia bacterium]